MPKAKKKVEKTKEEPKKKSKSSGAVYDGFEKIVVLIGLLLFNLIFVAWLFFGIVGILIGFLAASFALVLSGLGLFIAGMVYPFARYSWIAAYVSTGDVSGFALLFIGIAFVCFGLSWAIINYYLVRHFARAVSWWVILNYRVFQK